MQLCRTIKCSYLPTVYVKNCRLPLPYGSAPLRSNVSRGLSKGCVVTMSRAPACIRATPRSSAARSSGVKQVVVQKTTSAVSGHAASSAKASPHSRASTAYRIKRVETKLLPYTTINES
jgi:hypothetical protein